MFTLPQIHTSVHTAAPNSVQFTQKNFRMTLSHLPIAIIGLIVLWLSDFLPRLLLTTPSQCKILAFKNIHIFSSLCFQHFLHLNQASTEAFIFIPPRFLVSENWIRQESFSCLSHPIRSFGEIKGIFEWDIFAVYEAVTEPGLLAGVSSKSPRCKYLTRQIS